MKKILNFISQFITIILFVNVIFLGILVISSKASGGEPEIMGYQLKTVLSGSMEPSILTGAVIALQPLEGKEKETLKKGDIITFQTADNILVTHRIHKVVHSGEHVLYETKGDNNQVVDKDLVISGNVVASYSGLMIPYLGYVVDFSQSKEGSLFLLVFPGLLMLVYSISILRSGFKELDRKMGGNGLKES